MSAFIPRLCVVALLLGIAATSSACLAAETPYCFSGVCLGDAAGTLKKVSLDDLSHNAQPHPPAANLVAAFPAITNGDRTALARHVDSTGRFLLDRTTEEIFFRLGRVCAPVAPFVAVFTSESGHRTAIEFDLIKVGGNVQSGVKRITRIFQTNPGTAEHAALVADLSEKFGFEIDRGVLHDVPDGVTAAYEAGKQGFQLSFALPDLEDPNRDIRSQTECGPATRIKMD